MAIVVLPTGEVTTTFLIEQEKLEQERQRRIEEINNGVIRDAVRWRVLPESVRKRLSKKYRLGD